MAGHVFLGMAQEFADDVHSVPTVATEETVATVGLGC